MNYNMITAVIAIAAIFSPVVVTIINNQFTIRKIDESEKRRERKNREYYNHRIYEDFLKNANKVINTCCEAGLKEYSEIYPVLLLNAPDTIINEIIELNSNIVAYKYDEAKKMIQQVAFIIRKEIYGFDN